MRRWARVAVALAILTLAATLLPGWFVVKQQLSFQGLREVQGAAQIEVIGDVLVVTTFCGSNGTLQCDNGVSNAPLTIGPTTRKQFLVAYLVSDRVEAPQSIPGTFGALPVTFLPDLAYTTQLQALLPPGPGTKWAGYRTVELAETPLAGVDLVLAPRFRLLRGTNGSAFTGPFLFRTISGARTTPPNQLATRPTVCGNPITTIGDANNTWCLDWPENGDLSTAPLATRDLGVLPGSAGSALPGGTATSSFTLDFAGAPDPTATFALSATTNLPGATASVAGPFTPAAPDEDKSVPVQIAIPAGAAPGTYVVTLKAEVGGQSRSGSVEFSVLTPPPPPPPPPSFTLTGTPVQATYRNGLLQGAILLRGAAGQATSLRVSLTRRQTRSTNEPAAIARTITVADGPFEERFTLPARLGPGPYLLKVTPTVGALALAEETRNILIPGPPNGLVQRAVFSSRPNGSPATRLPRPRPALFVRFVFSSLPLPRRPITITFLGPNGRQAAPPIGKPRRQVVSAEIRARPSLPAGLWRAVLRVNRVVVATASVRVR